MADKETSTTEIDDLDRDESSEQPRSAALRSGLAGWLPNLHPLIDPKQPTAHLAVRAFPGLDGLRALAAAFVLIFHCANSVKGDDWLNVTGGRYILRFGNVGVAIFFVISGFLLSRPFFANHLLGRPFGDIRRYTIRRLTRIVPAYWVALTVWLFVVRTEPPFGGARLYPIFYLFQQIYWHGYVDTNGALSVAWTLCIEISFYAVLPAVAFGFCWLASKAPSTFKRTWNSLVSGSSKGSKKKSPLRLAGSSTVTTRSQVMVLASLCLALYLIGSLLRLRLRNGNRDSAFLTYSILGHFGWFGLGMALAVISAGVAAGVKAPRWLRDLAKSPEMCLAIAAGLIWLTGLLPPPAKGFGINTANDDFIIHSCNGLVGALCVIPFMIGNQAKGTVRAIFSSPAAQWLGNLSYGFYLWHTIVLTEVRQWAADEKFFSGFWPTLIAVTLLSLAVAHVSWTLLERPIQRWTKRVTAS